ncbi:MAG: DUF2309 domain-containing protein, partial [Bacteroidota bacterium]
SFYLRALQKGQIKPENIAQALADNTLGFDTDVNQFLSAVYDEKTDNLKPRVSTFVDIASDINGKKWSRFMVDRISFWASAYFDEKQALWNTASMSSSLFQSWKKEASVDFGAEVMGLKGFRKYVNQISDNYLEASVDALEHLAIPHSMMDYYLHSLLMKLNGWAGFAARIDWDAHLQGEKSSQLQEFLAILLVWESALKRLLNYPELEPTWKLAKQDSQQVIAEGNIENDLSIRLILQQAFDIANQKRLIEKINDQEVKTFDRRAPKFQAIFCIDVRSETFRRNLETINNDLETIGFAGFFAFPIKYVPLGHDHGTNQCPVLLTTSHTVEEKIADSVLEKKALKKRSLQSHVSKAIKAFKQGAISCFGFVSPLGIYFLPKLISDAFGWSRDLTRGRGAGLNQQEIQQLSVDLKSPTEGNPAGIPLEDRIKMGASALKAMSLTENFGKVVLITGHGSSSENNPHASGLDCGACGGNSGEANAKVAAAVLNDTEVRKGLQKEGIKIPFSTLFIPALHDTTTDEVTLFTYSYQKHPAYDLRAINELKYALKMAGEMSRKERGERMGVTEGDINSKVIKRSSDWSQVRPEWGLAGCSSFIVAPRERTAQLNLEGKAFMHNYDWKKDEGFGVLELIMTAPMVVTSWINLQYYASTVDNKVFGAGNKTLHNVVGGLGVQEGFAGDLRVGLPIQSVHDGVQFQHEPQRLNVIIEAPVDEMSIILSKHEAIRNLLDNQWIYLFAIDQKGKVTYQYDKDLQWKVI